MINQEKNKNENIINLNKINKSQPQLIPFCKLLRIIIIFFVSITINTCYTVERETITAELGERIPLQLRYYKLSDGGSITVSKSGYKNDYYYNITNKDKSKEAGKFRGIRIKENIYAMQIMPDKESYSQIIFYRINIDSFSTTGPESNKDMVSLARKYDVKIEEDDDWDFLIPGDDWLKGSSLNIVKFLYALREINFTEE